MTLFAYEKEEGKIKCRTTEVVGLEGVGLARSYCYVHTKNNNLKTRPLVRRIAMDFRFSGLSAAMLVLLLF